MHIWATKARQREIMKSAKRTQTGATYFVEKVSGKKTLSVLIETPWKNFFRSILLCFLAMLFAWVIWFLCMKQLGLLMLEVPGLNEKTYKMPRLWINIIIYSIAIIWFNKIFKRLNGKIVFLENWKYM